MQNRMMQMLIRRLVSMVMSTLFRKVTGKSMPRRGGRPF
jgi:hypothetical protein